MLYIIGNHDIRKPIVKKNADRARSLELGLSHYHGQPCKHCSGTLRNAGDGSCVECNKTRSRVRMAKLRETGAHLEAQYRYEQSPLGKVARSKYNSGAGKINNKKATLKNKFGMTIDQYIMLLEQQGEKCAVCSTPRNNLKRDLSVDHNHTTGKIRGLLCDNCNIALGHLKEDTERMKNMIRYVETHL